MHEWKRNEKITEERSKIFQGIHATYATRTKLYRIERERNRERNDRDKRTRKRKRGSSGACTSVQQRRRQEIVLDARRVKLVSSRCAHATRSGRTSFRTSLRCPVVLSVRFSLGLSTCPVRGREIRDASARKWVSFTTIDER